MQRFYTSAARHVKPSLSRNFHAAPSAASAKVVLALYPDPKAGYPPKYARDSVPHIAQYEHLGKVQTTPTPSGVDFHYGDLLGCVSGELGLRKFLEDRGHTLVVTQDKCARTHTFDLKHVFLLT